MPQSAVDLLIIVPVHRAEVQKSKVLKVIIFCDGALHAVGDAADQAVKRRADQGELV